VQPVIVQTSLLFALSLLAEAGLSFIGLGVQPPDPSWGSMLGRAYKFMRKASYKLQNRRTAKMNGDVAAQGRTVIYMNRDMIEALDALGTNSGNGALMIRPMDTTSAWPLPRMVWTVSPTVVTVRNPIASPARS